MASSSAVMMMRGEGGEREEEDDEYRCVPSFIIGTLLLWPLLFSFSTLLANGVRGREQDEDASYILLLLLVDVCVSVVE
eukprot:scaffold4487_cov273-Chaetoceros_neogracile.AAC.4